jgi:hypothetical protein
MRQTGRPIDPYPAGVAARRQHYVHDLVIDGHPKRLGRCREWSQEHARLIKWPVGRQIQFKLLVYICPLELIADLHQFRYTIQSRPRRPVTHFRARPSRWKSRHGLQTPGIKIVQTDHESGRVEHLGLLVSIDQPSRTCNGLDRRTPVAFWPVGSVDSLGIYCPSRQCRLAALKA